jgi:hypothetical protein
MAYVTMKRAILLLAVLACCGEVGCEKRSTAKVILTVVLNSELPKRVIAGAGSVAVADADSDAETGVPKPIPLLTRARVQVPT